MQKNFLAIDSYRAHETTTPTRRIYIERTGTSTKGDVYQVSYEAAVLLGRTRLPLLDAARKLRNAGLTGRLEMYRVGDQAPAMVADVEAASLLTVVDNGQTSATFARYQLFEETAIAPIAANAGAPSA
ncbi:hypothetical protein [Hyphomicrobium sp.]|uniref:hypothetical protein n=1 Tax=Hyphomicrobium sp. TaxID=82 RepID=UPI002D7A3957|nr:hypothetical protein [Hyphomicrobium sp.]HET6388218.1 hypothetical protein [Hyphomicrobium sp.]